MKNNRSGQASVFSLNEYSKIRRCITCLKYKLLFDLAWFTGERWGALVQIKVADLYDGKIVRRYITFRACTRKKCGGQRKTRQVPVHPTLGETLQSYTPDPQSEWLFPTKRNYTTGEITKHISLRYADDVLRKAVMRAGLESRGISTHSTRRSFATHLARNGVSLRIIQKLLGYADLKMLALYIDVNDTDLEGAIATL